MIDRLKNNTTLKELIAGAAAYCIVWEICLLVFTGRKLYHSAGLAAGLIVCVILAVSMAESIDVAVMLDEKGARAYIQKKASLRYIIVCAAVVLLELTGIGNPLTFLPE